MLFYFKARSCTIIPHITVWWNRHCAIHFYFMFSLFLRTKIAFTSWKINERNYWRTITSKKSVICLIKVNYASYNYTQCIRTWHLLPSCGRSKYLRSKIKGQNLFSYHSQFFWNFKFVILTDIEGKRHGVLPQNFCFRFEGNGKIPAQEPTTSWLLAWSISQIYLCKLLYSLISSILTSDS